MFIFFIIMFQRQKNMSKFIKVQTFFLNFLFCIWVQLIKGFPGGASGKKPGCQCKRHKRRGSIPGSVRSPEEENGNPLQYSCLANPMGRGAWWAMVHRVAKSQTQLKKLKLPLQAVLVVKNLPTNAGSIPGLRRSPREGHGNPLQYSCLKNIMDRGDWQATVLGVAKSWT